MDRSYYLAQDKATDVYRMVRAFVIYLILICILPWCNFGLWNLIDYSSMKVGQVRERSHEVTLRWSTDLRVVDADGQEQVRRLPAGTPVRVLAICYDLPDERVLLSYKPWAEYQIELRDGTRGLAVVPETATGLEVKVEVDGRLEPRRVVRVERLAENPMKSETKRSDYPYLYVLDSGEKLAFEPLYWPIRGQMPVYTWRSPDKEYLIVDRLAVFDRDLNRLKGDSLAAIEALYEPAQSVVVKGSRKYAFLPSVDVLQNDSLLYRTLMLVFENDTLADYHISGQSTRSLPFFSHLINSHIRYNPNYVRAGYYAAYPLGEGVGSRLLPLWAARGVVGLADAALLLLLAFVVSWGLRHTVIYLRPLSNRWLKVVGVLCILVVYHLYLFYFSMVSVNMFFVYVALILSAMFWSADVNGRCPYCHTVKGLKFLGRGDLKRVVTVDEYDDSRLLSRKVERQGDKLVISDTVDEFVTRETSVVEHYYSYYRCSCCNRSVRFKGKRLVGKEVTYRDREGRK